MTERAFVALGSNLRDRAAHLDRARVAMSLLPSSGSPITGISAPSRKRTADSGLSATAIWLPRPSSASSPWSFSMSSRISSTDS